MKKVYNLGACFFQVFQNKLIIIIITVSDFPTLEMYNLGNTSVHLRNNHDN